MKIGNKVLVTYSNGDQCAGSIVGETAKSWKVEFDSGDTRTIRKTMDIDILDTVEDVNPKPEPVVEETVAEEVVHEDDCCKDDPKPFEPTHYTPSKRLKRNNVIILVGILVAAAAVAYVLLTQLQIF